MDRMLTEPASTNQLERVVSAEQRKPHTDRPWVMANMITTLDGAAAMNGTSGALGNAGDREIFRILRAQSDVIVAGAGTVRDEQYRTPSTPSDDLGRDRAERGQTPRPQLCVVSRSTEMTPAPPALTDPSDAMPTILATTHANACSPTVASRTATWAGDVELLGAGTDGVEPDALLGALAERGCNVVLLEGGPTLLAEFATQGLVDEWNLTIAPMISGTDPRIVASALDNPMRLELDRMMRHESHLFLRYLTDAD